MVCLGEGRVYMRANLKWQAGRKEGGISSNEQAHSSHSAGALLVLDGYGQGISASGHAAFGSIPSGSSQPCMGLLSGHQSWEQPPAAGCRPPSLPACLPPCLITLHYTSDQGELAVGYK